MRKAVIIAAAIGFGVTFNAQAFEFDDLEIPDPNPAFMLYWKMPLERASTGNAGSVGFRINQAQEMPKRATLGAPRLNRSPWLFDLELGEAGLKALKFSGRSLLRRYTALKL